MARADARQTDNQVSMEEATSLSGRRKALAARRTKAAAGLPSARTSRPRSRRRARAQGQGRRP